MNYKKVFKRETKVIAYVVIALTLVVIGSSYALFLQVKNNDLNQVVTAGSLKIVYAKSNVKEPDENDENNCLIPRADETGSCDFTLSITNDGTLPMQYDLLIYDDVEEAKKVDENAELVDHEMIKHTLNKQLIQEGAELENVSNAKLLSALEEKNGKRVLETNTINVGETLTFSLNIWLDENAPNIDSVVGKYVYLKLDVVGTVYENETESVNENVVSEDNQENLLN